MMAGALGLGTGIGAAVAVVGAGLSAAASAGQMLLDVLGKVAEKTVDIGIHAVKLAANFEISAAKFEVLTGSKVVGDKLLDDIQKLAIKTPYNSKDFINFTPQLLASGVGVESIIPVLSRLGDIAMGDSQKLFDLGYAFTNSMNIGKLRAQEVNLQFANAGFGVKNFADAAGLSIPKFLAAMEAGEMGVNVMIDAINNATNAGGTFAGMNAKMGEKVMGQWNALTESIEFSLRVIGTKLFEAFDVAPTLGKMADFAIDFQGHLGAINPYLQAGADIMRDGWGQAVGVWESLESAVQKNRVQIDEFLPTIDQVSLRFHNLGQNVIAFGIFSLEAFEAASWIIRDGLVRPLLWASTAFVKLTANMAALGGALGDASMQKVAEDIRQTQADLEFAGNGLVNAMTLSGEIAKEWSAELASNLDGGAKNLGKTLGEFHAAMMRQSTDMAASAVAGPAAFAPTIQPDAQTAKLIARVIGPEVAGGAFGGMAGALAPRQPIIPLDVQGFATKLQAEMKQGISPLAKFQETQRLANAAFMADLIKPEQWEFAIGNAFGDLEKVFQRMSETHLPKALSRGTREAESIISRAMSRTESKDPMKEVERILKDAVKSEKAQESKMRELVDLVSKIEWGVAGF